MITLLLSISYDNYPDKNIMGNCHIKNIMKIKRISPFKGKKHSEESKLKNRLSHLGKKMPSIAGDKNPAKRPEVRAKMSASRRKWKPTEEHKQKIRQSMLGQHAGKENPDYIDGRTSIKTTLFNSKKYKVWRFEVFKKDNFTCQECGQSAGNLEVHHKIEFHILLEEFLSEYNYLDPFDREDKKELLKLGLKWDNFWDIDNGKTLCKKCHTNKHASYNLIARTK